jgi:hypothetical protein
MPMKDNISKPKMAPRPGDWVDVLAPHVIDQFRGKHIAIIHKRVVASGTSYGGVLEKSGELFPDETPYLAYIPTNKESKDEETAAIASNMGQFFGQYVAVIDRNVVASGPTRKLVSEEAERQFPGQTPHYVYIPTADEADSDQIATIIFGIATGSISSVTSKDRIGKHDTSEPTSVDLNRTPV